MGFALIDLKKAIELMTVSLENNLASESSEAEGTIGLVAGSGIFPIQFIKNAKTKGFNVVVVAHQGDTEIQIDSLGVPVEWIKLGQLGKIIKIFKREKVERIAFAGGISRPNILKGNLWVDRRGISLLLKVKSVKDDVLLRAIAAELEGEGFKVFSATKYLPEFVSHDGVLTKRDLTISEKNNAKIGWLAAKIIGSADIGQTIVISQEMVVAVEAIEGTDATIRRAGSLISGKGGVVVKVSKPQQDDRLDLPTIGVATIESMKEAGLTALVIETGKTIILHPVDVVAAANSANIALVSLSNI